MEFWSRFVSLRSCDIYFLISLNNTSNWCSSTLRYVNLFICMCCDGYCCSLETREMCWLCSCTRVYSRIFYCDRFSGHSRVRSFVLSNRRMIHIVILLPSQLPRKPWFDHTKMADVIWPLWIIKLTRQTMLIWSGDTYWESGNRWLLFSYGRHQAAFHPWFCSFTVAILAWSPIRTQEQWQYFRRARDRGPCP